MLFFCAALHPRLLLLSVFVDPGHQFKPAAWEHLAGAVLADAVYNHTYAALAAFAAQGTPVAIVQVCLQVISSRSVLRATAPQHADCFQPPSARFSLIIFCSQVGNEVTNGMLWAATGEPCSNGGALYQPGCETTSSWADFSSLLAAGVRAVRAAAPSATVLIHTDLGNKLGSNTDASYITWWYSTLQASGAKDWDGIGLSFYPHWGAGNTTDIAKLADVASAFPGKRIVLAETSYPFQGAPAPPGSQFPYTVAGQLSYTQAVLEAVRGLGRGVGWGVAWWGGEYYNQTSGAGWTSLWDELGVALPALEQGWRY
jgi:arabinogalactan endo-1,4-beta-galactosidase